METKQKIDYNKVFNLFIGDNEHRPDMHQPFKRAGMYFATDAYSMIFMPDDGSLQFTEQQKPLAEKVIPKDENIHQEISIESLDRQLVPEMVNETIEEYKTEKCEECNGKGMVYDECGKEPCDQCDGEGNFKSVIDVPTGRKIPNPDKDFVMLGVGYKYEQLRRLVDACQLMGVEKIKQTYKAKKSGNLFTCGNVQILVMPAINYDSQRVEIKI